jgi:hypothetical protein
VCQLNTARLSLLIIKHISYITTCNLPCNPWTVLRHLWVSEREAEAEKGLAAAMTAKGGGLGFGGSVAAMTAKDGGLRSRV